MKIYAMTASFGKLEGETLRLEPGLNVFTAPNEWGKSTWCAFLLAMFYGLDTRAKSTKNSLAPKDHYAPWSGKPMSGRIDLNWKGRDITIERGTRGRVPLGEFRAYETASGLTVPELTAQNCGKEILGVEREIFCRTGFIRQADLPDFQSELLRSRLTDLVTTGDDSGDAKVLADSLKDLKNRCKRLIPQAQAQLTQLEDGLQRLTVLEDRCARLEKQAQEAEIRRRQLENHLSALENRQVSQARKDWERACREKAYWEERCADLPTKEEARKRLNDLRDYNAAWEAAARNQGNLEPEPPVPEFLPAFAGLDPKQAQTKAENDAAAYRDSVGKESLIFLLLGLLALVLGAIVALPLGRPIPGLALAGAGVVLLGLSLLRSGQGKGKLEALGREYGTADWKLWPELAADYAAKTMAYAESRDGWQKRAQAVESRLEELEKTKNRLCEGKDLAEMEDLCRQVLESWETLEKLRQTAAQLKAHLDALTAMAAPASQGGEDSLTLSLEQTRQELENSRREQTTLQHDLGAARGAKQALGDRQILEGEKAAIQTRLAALQAHYQALDIGQQTAEEASRTLQRRFAPQIAKQAGAYLNTLTEGRYTGLTLTESLHLLAGTQEDSLLRDALWRSDGTVDALYLCARLAAAQALMPQTPIILDDALIRFDDRRLEKAVELLKELGKERQILLFSCQGREERKAR